MISLSSVSLLLSLAKATVNFVDCGGLNVDTPLELQAQTAFHIQPLTISISRNDLWWAQVESNHRPHAYQACALTFWAMSPCYLHNHRKSPRFFNRWSGVLSFEPRFGFSTDGGDEGIRTLDPLLAGQVLSQLSYTPIFEVYCQQPYLPIRRSFKP